MNKLKRFVKERAMAICGEEDRFRGEKITIAPLQISTELPSVERAKLFGHGHRREDIAEYFRIQPHGNVQYTQLFDEVKLQIEQIAEKGFNIQAKKHFECRHGNLVVIVGQPGIGKSTMTKRLVEEMWELSLFEPDIVFFIRFRDLDYIHETDLLEFFAPYVADVFTEDDRKTILEMLSKSKKVFIIMDGLDEATISPNMNQPTFYSIHSKSTAETFIQNIIAGNILPQSKKMVTSRPYRIAQLPKDFQPKVFFTIQGLDEAALQQICENICDRNMSLCKKILVHLQSHPDLKSYCHTPVICIMVMKALHKLYAEENNVNLLNDFDLLQSRNVDTLTAIFVFVLKEWLIEKLERTDKFQIKELSDLALKGFNQDQFYFRVIDLKKSNVNFKNNTTFLNTILKGTKIMYFIHLMWQEFLTSINLTLYTNKEDFKSMLDKLNIDKYEVVTKFLFGLCNNHILDELLDYVEIEDLNSETDREECTELLKEMAKQKLDFETTNDRYNRGSYFNSILPLLGLIREMGSDDWTGDVAAILRDEICIGNSIPIYRVHTILPSDIASISYVFRFRRNNLALEIDKPQFARNCSSYFYKQLHATLDQNSNIRVSLLLFFKKIKNKND